MWVCHVVCGCVRAAEVVLIGYDARAAPLQLTSQLVGVSSKAVLIAGSHTSVRHSVGVVFGFVVGLSAPVNQSAVRLQLWRPLVNNDYQLVCQRQIILGSNASHDPIHEVPTPVRTTNHPSAVTARQ